MNGTYGYNASGELTRAAKTLTSTGASLEGRNFRYTFDGIGNRTSIQTGGDSSAVNLRTATYTPDALNQYSAITQPGFLEIYGKAPTAQPVTVNTLATTRQGRDFRKELSYSNTNQLWQTVTTNGGSLSISQHHLPAASTIPTYDLDGNLTSDGQWTYTWDAEQCARIGSILDKGEAIARRVNDALSRIMNQNRLASATRNAAALTAGAPYRAISYNYDSLSRKITRSVATTSGGPLTTEKYLYDGWNCIAEYANSSLNTGNFQLATSRLWGLDQSGTLQGAGGVGGLLLITDHSTLLTSHYPCYDGNGNVRKLLNATTLATTATYDYGPFGELIRATGPYAATNSYRFSTKPQDKDTGLMYYNYRHYDTRTGRWLNRDPIEENSGLNLYGFVDNSPISWYDVLGLATVTVNVDRYARTKASIFSIVTVSSDDEEINNCCSLPKSFQGTEAGDHAVNRLGPGTYPSEFNPENGNLKTGTGLTSIKGRVARDGKSGRYPGGGHWWITIPAMPEEMNPSDYQNAIENEFRTGDGGDNIHSGVDSRHSSGCVVLGVCPNSNQNEAQRYQNSIFQDLKLKAAIACARRKVANVRFKTIANAVPSLSTGPVIPRAIPVNPNSR